MNIILASMHRSGTNCIGQWLLRQSDLQDIDLTRMSQPGKGYIEQYHGEQSYAYISSISHPHHQEYTCGFCDNNVVTIERENTGRSLEIMNHEVFAKFQKVMVIREFKNWLASTMAMHHKFMGTFSIPNPCLDKYSSYLNLYIENPNDITFILYDKWVQDVDYRMHICKQLDLSFTDCGINDVRDYGGGSSFDGTKYHKQAKEMKVLERYKEMESKNEYRSALRGNIIELSDRVFHGCR